MKFLKKLDYDKIEIQHPTPYKTNWAVRSIMKKGKLTIIFSFLTLTLLFTQCRTRAYNMQTNNKNYKKAVIIFNEYFSKNDNAFLLSVGTIGSKYIWTIASDSIILTIIDINGKKKTTISKTTNNWTQTAILIFQEPDCPMLLDSDILKFKIKNQQGQVIDESMIYDINCLSKCQNELIMSIFADMKTIKIEI